MPMLDLRAWIHGCDPAPLLTISDSWLAFSTDIEDLFERYAQAVTTVDGTYWEGRCAQAALDRATADQHTVKTLADKIEIVAQCATQGYHRIDAPLRRAKGALTDAELRGYTVGPDLALSIPPGRQITDTDKQQLLDLQAELHDAARSLAAADQAVRDALDSARADLRPAFISAATLGAEQGWADGTLAANDTKDLTPEQIQRIMAAGQLTDEQLDALRRGDTAIIPAAQMHYLTALSQAMGDKSPRDIQAIMTHLPPLAQTAFANTFQIMSNPNIDAGPAVPDDPTSGGRGSLALLPRGMRESLTRPDLVTNDTTAGFLHTTHFNGVADNQAIAALVGASDPQYRLGTDVDRRLLDVGATYLDGYENWRNAHDVVSPGLRVDGVPDSQLPHTGHGIRLTEDLFAAAGTDKPAVEGLLATGDRDRLLQNIFTHPWSDRGHAVSTLFHVDDGAAFVHDPTNPIDVRNAQRTGHIMSSVAEYLAGGTETGGNPHARWSELTGFRNYADTHTIGALNPSLVQEISHSLVPYVDALAGNPSDSLPGFDITPHLGPNGTVANWLDPEGNGSYQGAANIFGLINTDPDPKGASQTLNGAAVFGVLRNEAAYAHDPGVPGATDALSTAGRLNGLVDKGMFMASEADHQNSYADASDIYTRRRTAYDEMKALTSRGTNEFLPGGKYVGDILTGGGDSLKEWMIGEKPTEPATQGVTLPNFNLRAYESLSQAELPADLQSQYPGLFANGRLRPWQDIQLDPHHEQLSNEINEAFAKYGLPNDNHANQFERSYNQITRDVQSQSIQSGRK